jgi:hypothetical protein
VWSGNGDRIAGRERRLKRRIEQGFEMPPIVIRRCGLRSHLRVISTTARLGHAATHPLVILCSNGI